MNAGSSSADVEVTRKGPLELKNSSERAIRARFHEVLHDVLSFINSRPDQYPFSKPATHKLLVNQARAIAAVCSCEHYTDFKKILYPCYKVAQSTFSRYRKMVIYEELSYQDVLATQGRPLVYSPKVDEAFILWLSDEKTATIEKNTACLVETYRKLHSEEFGTDAGDELSDEGIRRHINTLLCLFSFKMRTPEVVDAKRCIKYDVLRDWYCDRWIKQALTGKHPRLIFNGDETEINRKPSFKGKVAWRGKGRPRIAAKDRSGGHVSMFIIISGNELVKPSFLLHAGPDSFVSQPSLFENDVVCVRTANGYMERWTFKNIMIHHFIPYVQRVREELHTQERAALIVDGHLSRYDLDTILPAHSSHITQPLDITLNGLIKRAFPVEYRKGVSQSVLDVIEELDKGKVQY